MSSLRNLSDGDPTSPDRWPLRRRITSVGRTADNKLSFCDSELAGVYATITCEGSEFVVRRAEKKAPLTVNDKRVRRKKTLQHGDEIGFGDARYEFCLFGDTAPDTGASEAGATRRLAGLEQIHQLSLDLLRTTDIDELLESVVDSAIELTGADKGFVVLTDDDSWSIEVARNVDAQSLTAGGQHLSDSLLQRVFTSRQPLIIADARNDEEFHDAQSVIDLELCSVLCVPLLDRGQVLGVIYVGNDRITSQFDELDLDLLSIFAAKLSLLIANAILLDELRSDRRSLQERLEDRRFGSLIGASQAMKPVFHAIDRVAPTDVTVLVTGETGTGKELVAGELHRRSNRADGPFVTLNCGAIPENLLESELFGHVKGAFTGASARRDGKFHSADGGTIFLDEIGEMPMQLQIKLLRVLQEYTFSRVGSDESETVDIRVVAATNRDLEEQVSKGAFREDLYYRLNVVEIGLPPLRDRGEDCILIAEYLIDSICQKLDLSSKKLGPDAMQAIRNFEWPGNVRQLENRLKKALVLARRSTLSAGDLDLGAEKLPPPKSLADAKEEFALHYVLEVLERNGGNRTQTARDLNVDPRTVFRYLEKHSASAQP